MLHETTQFTRSKTRQLGASRQLTEIERHVLYIRQPKTLPQSLPTLHPAARPHLFPSALPPTPLHTGPGGMVKAISGCATTHRGY